MTDPNKFPVQQYDNIKDILPDHAHTFNGVDGEQNEFFDPAGNSIPQHQMDMIQENQDLIRNTDPANPADGPTVESPIPTVPDLPKSPEGGNLRIVPSTDNPPTRIHPAQKPGGMNNFDLISQSGDAHPTLADKPVKPLGPKDMVEALMQEDIQNAPEHLEINNGVLRAIESDLQKNIPDLEKLMKLRNILDNTLEESGTEYVSTRGRALDKELTERVLELTDPENWLLDEQALVDYATIVNTRVVSMGKKQRFAAPSRESILNRLTRPAREVTEILRPIKNDYKKPPVPKSPYVVPKEPDVLGNRDLSLRERQLVQELGTKNIDGSWSSVKNVMVNRDRMLSEAQKKARAYLSLDQEVRALLDEQNTPEIRREVADARDKYHKDIALPRSMEEHAKRNKGSDQLLETADDLFKQARFSRTILSKAKERASREADEHAEAQRKQLIEENR